MISDEARGRLSTPIVVASLTAVAVLGVYVATMSTGIAGGDAGELVAAVVTGGVPHPPGYPLFVLFTKPFTWLPVLTVAWRANLAAAVAAAGAAAVMAWIVIRLTRKWWAGPAAALAFAFSPTVWLYATGAEVFALNNLIVAIEVALLVAVDRAPVALPADRARRVRLVAIAAFVCGLGASNHHTSIVVNGVVFAAIVWRTRASLRPKVWLILAACVVAGLLPYLYLLSASASRGLVSWGDTQTLAGFAAHVLRRDYGSLQLTVIGSRSTMGLADQLGYWASDLVNQLSWVGVIAAALGLSRGLARRDTRFVTATTAIACAAYLVILHSLATLPLDQPLIHGVAARFWQQADLFLCLWAGIGVGTVTVVSGRVMAAVAIGLGFTQAAIHARELNHRGDMMVEDYGRSILRSLPPGALVLMRGDLITNSARYYQAVEQVRPDVRLLDQEMLTYPWMTRQIRTLMPDVIVPGTHYAVNDLRGYVLRQLVDANIRNRPVVVCGSTKPGDASVDATYRRDPIGLCDRLQPAGSSADVDALLAASDAAQPVFRNDMRRVPPAESWEHVAWVDTWEARHRAAGVLLDLAIARHDDPALLRAAADRLDRLVREDPLPQPYYYKNLGIAWDRLRAVDSSAAAHVVDAWQIYLRVGPRNDPDRAAIEQAVRLLSGGR